LAIVLVLHLLLLLLLLLLLRLRLRLRLLLRLLLRRCALRVLCRVALHGEDGVRLTQLGAERLLELRCALRGLLPLGEPPLHGDQAALLHGDHPLAAV